MIRAKQHQGRNCINKEYSAKLDESKYLLSVLIFGQIL